MRLPRGRGIGGRREALSPVSAVPRQLMRKPPGPLIDHNNPFRLLGSSTERSSSLLNSPSREQKRRRLSPGDLGQSQPLCKISFLTYMHYLIGG